MDISTLVRDKKYITSVLSKLSDGTTRVKEECRIYIPTKYTEKGLASIGADTYIVGIFPIVCNGKFSTLICNAMIRIDPALTNRLTINEEHYIEFVFPKDSVMFLSNNVVRINTLTYKIFEYYHSGAHVPWFVTYNQMSKLYASAKDYADANIGINHETDELLASVIARNPNNRREYFRQCAEFDNDLRGNQPVYISMRNIAYSATNTMSKMGGSRFTDGTVSALVSPTTRVEPIERLLRA